MYTTRIAKDRIIGFGEIKVLLGIQNNRQLSFELNVDHIEKVVEIKNNCKIKSNRIVYFVPFANSELPLTETSESRTSVRMS